MLLFTSAVSIPICSDLVPNDLVPFDRVLGPMCSQDEFRRELL